MTAARAVSQAVNDARYDGPECLSDPHAGRPGRAVLAPMPLSPLLAAYDHVVLDLDGCVWVGETADPRRPRGGRALRAAGQASRVS